MPADEPSSAALAEAMARSCIDEAVAGAGIGRNGDFPARCSWPCPRWRWSGRKRRALAGAVPDATGYDDLLRGGGTAGLRAWYERFLFGSVAEALADAFGTKGSPVATSTACASGATAIQLGVEAIRRGEAGGGAGASAPTPR